MPQITINVGTVSNDGTGDTIRGAFTNVNSNFTEVYNNISSVVGVNTTQNTSIGLSISTANSAYDKANAANLLAFTVSVGANAWSNNLASSGNSYSQSIGAASNTWANTVGTAGNNYVSILVANNAVGANGWANTLSATDRVIANNAANSSNAWANTLIVATNEWANSKFETISNTGLAYNQANLAYNAANNSLQNTTITVLGKVSSVEGFADQYAPLRDKLAFVVNSNISMVYISSLIIANNSNTIYINVEDDTKFPSSANIGTTIDIYQIGTGVTSVRSNSASVTLNSPNNCLTMANQFTSAKLVKVSSNNWFLTGSLKA